MCACERMGVGVRVRAMGVSPILCFACHVVVQASVRTCLRVGVGVRVVCVCVCVIVSVTYATFSASRSRADKYKEKI